MRDPADVQAQGRIRRRVGDAAEVAHRAALEAARRDPTASDVEGHYLRAVRVAADEQADELDRLAARDAEWLRRHEQATRAGEGAAHVVDAVDTPDPPTQTSLSAWYQRPRPFPWDRNVRIRGCGLDGFEPCEDVSWQLYNGGLDEGEFAEQTLTSDGCDATVRFALESGDRYLRGSTVEGRARFELTAGAWRDETAWCLRPRVTAAGHLVAVTGAAIARGDTEIWARLVVHTFAVSPPSNWPALLWTNWSTVMTEWTLGPYDQVVETIAATTATSPAATFFPPAVDRDGPRDVSVEVRVVVEAWVSGHAVFGMRIGGSSLPGVRVHGLEWGVTDHFRPLLPSEPWRPWRPGGPAS